MRNLSSAQRTPPSKGVPSGPSIKASQLKMSSSLSGPATMPIGGSVERALHSEKRRREARAVPEAIFGIVARVLGHRGRREVVLKVGRRGAKRQRRKGEAKSLFRIRCWWGGGIVGALRAMERNIVESGRYELLVPRSANDATMERQQTATLPASAGKFRIYLHVTKVR